MKTRISIGLVGDRSDAVVAHQAIPAALALVAAKLGLVVNHEWVPTVEVDSHWRVSSFDALWGVPGSPYRSAEGALRAIRHARESAVPFLGTCGGFQHAVVEFARNVLGWQDAVHGETASSERRAVISALSCGRLEGGGRVFPLPGTRVQRAYAAAEVREEYLCSYGVNPVFRQALGAGTLRESAVDDDGELRAVELDGHPFFVATLFQPERAALRGIVPPLVEALVSAAR